MTEPAMHPDSTELNQNAHYYRRINQYFENQESVMLGDLRYTRVPVAFG